MEAMGAKYGIVINSLETYITALGRAFQEGLDWGMVAVKNGLAYNRVIQYDNSSEAEAMAVFNKLFSENTNKPASFEEVKPLQDYIMHRILDLARDFDLPVQIHTGLHAGGKNEIRNSKPTLLTNLFNEYPDVEFVLMHSSYPYGAELSVLAKNYPNVFIDMCWTQLISPFYNEKEAIGIANRLLRDRFDQRVDGDWPLPAWHR
jgi:predicted TIM-barrel fold metal-dependent hydrolase